MILLFLQFVIPSLQYCFSKLPRTILLYTIVAATLVEDPEQELARGGRFSAKAGTSPAATF